MLNILSYSLVSRSLGARLDTATIAAPDQGKSLRILEGCALGRENSKGDGKDHIQIGTNISPMNAPDPQPDHTLFRALQLEVTNSHFYWKVYAQLFAHGELRIALLNETGSLVFYVLQRLLVDETTLAICRLTDPATTGQRKNQGLPLLIESVTAHKPGLAATMEADLNEVLQMATPLRKRRNRAIAHSDLATKLKIDGEVAPGISAEMINAILNKIRELMNRYETAYFNGITAYDMVITALGTDGDFLSEQLRRAVAFRDLEREGRLDRNLWINGRYRGA